MATRIDISKMKIPTYLYHKEKGAQIFDADGLDMEGMKTDGWVDNPAKLEQSTIKGDTQKQKSAEEWPDEVWPEPKKVEAPEPSDDKAKYEKMLETLITAPIKVNTSELKELANFLGVNIRQNWKRETIIARIKETITNVDN